MPRTPRQPPDDARIVALTQAVEQLSQHVESLYEMIDEFRLDFAALLERHAPPTPLVVNSFPRDPMAADWNERLNRYSVAEDEFHDDATSEIALPPRPSTQQRQLWAEDPAE